MTAETRPTWGIVEDADARLANVEVLAGILRSAAESRVGLDAEGVVYLAFCLEDEAKAGREAAAEAMARLRPQSPDGCA